jgi:membrane-associated phospholipid phosphatase
MTSARDVTGAADGWWWPNRPVRVPAGRTAAVLAGLGAVLFGGCALALAAGATGWDEPVFRVFNEVSPAVAAVLTPLSQLFRPAGIVAVIVLATGYVVARNRSVLPVAAGVLAASLGWAMANLAKAVASRPRPYDAVAGAVLRQQPAHGTSFPSSHTAIALAVAIALVPFLPRPVAMVGIGYAAGVGWSRMYLGVHYPLDVLGGAGIGALAGGLVLLALGLLLRRRHPPPAARPAAGGQAGQGQPRPGGRQEE